MERKVGTRGLGLVTMSSSVPSSLQATNTCPASSAHLPPITPGKGSQPALEGGFYSRPDSGCLECGELSTCSATPAELQALPDHPPPAPNFLPEATVDLTWLS